jgi:hypothetical protein
MTEPFRKCDYCGCNSRKLRVSNKPGANAWTLWGHSRKLSCPKCSKEGRAEDDQVNLLLLQFGDLLRHRLLAEPNTLYGNEHDHRGEPVQDWPESDLLKLMTAWQLVQVLRDLERIKSKFPGLVVLYHMGGAYHAFKSDALLLFTHTKVNMTVLTHGLRTLRHVRFGATQLDTVLPAMAHAGHRVAICEKWAAAPPVAVVDKDRLRVAEPVERFHLIQPQALEHEGHLMLHCDAETADDDPGDGCRNRALRIAVSTVVVDEPHPTEPIDFWDLPDMTAEEACVVQEPAATYASYLFPKSDEVSLCLLDRPYGTVVEVRVNWLGLEHDRIRTIHLSLCGGRASSETGYRSVFRHQSMLNLLSEAEVVELAKAECEYRFKELNPGTDPDQQRLF